MEQTKPITKSLFDFIYLDRDKLGSLYAQIFEHGLLLTSKHTRNHSDTTGSKSTSGLKMEAKADALLAGAKAETSGNQENHTNRIAGIGAEDTYDAYYATPINLLNKLDELGFINRGLNENSQYGQIVLISGEVRLSDIGIIRDLWYPMNERIFKEASKDAKMAKEAKNNLNSMNNLKPLVESLSKNIIFTLQTENYSAWSNLKREFVLIETQDFILKNSEWIPGKWFCLGIIDSLPSDSNRFEDRDGVNVNTALREARSFFEVNPNYFGITPIVIFRNIGN